MRGHVTNVRNQVRKELEKVTGGTKEAPPAGTPPPPAASAPPGVSPPPARPTAPPSAAPAPRPTRGRAQPEIIDAEPVPRPTRPARPFITPPVGIPRAPIHWLLFGGFVFVFILSTGATYAAMLEIWRPDQVSWWHAAGVQVVFSAVERLFFVGNRNLFTWGVLVFDGLINAVGLVVAILPAWFSSSLWQFVAVGPLAGYVYDGDSLVGKGIALALGMFLAYAGDALLDLAMRSGR